MSSEAVDFGELGEPLAQLQATLSSAGVELSARELSDALWLALHVPPRGPGVPASPCLPLDQNANQHLPRH